MLLNVVKCCYMLLNVVKCYSVLPAIWSYIIQCCVNVVHMLSFIVRYCLMVLKYCNSFKIIRFVLLLFVICWYDVQQTFV